MDKRIIIISDSHGRDDLIRVCLNLEKGADALIHCGDGADDLRGIMLPFQAMTVRGNVDTHLSAVEREVVGGLFGYRVLINHGDTLDVNSGLDRLLERALEVDADLVAFGHTHIQMVKDIPPLFINPGSLRDGHYARLLLTADGPRVELSRL